ncbi:hypothetical protein KFZ70_13300 [Tamlana fucoidanivorans]|uniref:DUF4136 domain-containing protein n=1 Tax=Allotamlana fucoidanivorans TaxID=2583814 RepID=A0A5C4SQ26_9FLAO|nr:hypothetical protein [Tamlana fucoidanivorans]TNJ46406.1 hypothetical protein FGF67_01925 [Tamlana fucoidanivorans]
MKRKLQIFTLFILTLALHNCGPSISVTDSWSAPDVRDIKGDKMLVMARMDDLASRQLFEQEIVSKLKTEGINAVASYNQYPDIKLNEKLTDEQIDGQVSRFKKDGFETIVLTVVKDVKTEMVTQESGGYVTGGYYPMYYGYYGGFGRYYGAFYSPYGFGGSYIPSSQRTYESDIYKLETVIYDLDRTDNRQLVAVVASSITDPDSASQVAGPYAKKVLGQFKKDGDKK